MENNEVKSNKSSRGYQIAILLLVILLAVAIFFYFRQTNQLKKEAEAEKTALSSQINTLRVDLGNIETSHAAISENLEQEKERADSLYEALQNERNVSRATIRRYENELKTLKDVMRRYVTQIDSLNVVNRSLAEESANYRKQASNERLRAQVAEEKASELTQMIKVGSVVRARDIELQALNSNDKPVTRAARAERLRIDFVLNANDLAIPGERMVYARITGPDGYVMAGDASSLFSYHGDKITYSAAREIDYQNQDLSVGLYYNGEVVSGAYIVEIYMDGEKIGTSEAFLK